MSEKATSPAFLFYSSDWIVGTSGMDWSVKGVYVTLLAFQHQKTGLPLKPEELSAMIGMPLADFLVIWNDRGLSTKFTKREGRLWNNRLDEIITKNTHQAKVNRIIAIYREVLRKMNLPQKQRDLFKKGQKHEFDVSIFLNEKHESLHELITKWITNRCTKLEDVNVNEDVLIHNTVNTDLKEKPQDFLKRYNEIEFDNLLMKSGIADREEREFAVTQWGLKVFENGWEYSPETKSDYSKLRAGLEKWLNSWHRNAKRGEFRGGQGNVAGGQQKPEFERIIKT